MEYTEYTKRDSYISIIYLNNPVFLQISYILLKHRFVEHFNYLDSLVFKNVKNNFLDIDLFRRVKNEEGW